VLDIQEISDRIEIQDLLARYAHAIDGRDWDALDRIFTPDAHIDYSAMGGAAGGVEEIKDFLAQAMPMFESFQHLVGWSVVDIDGDAASARTICHNPMVLHGGEDPHLLVCGLWYRDKLVRTPAGWRIAERVEERSYMKEEPPCPK
jgi:ketosteroid isomerase-like protein